MRPVRKRRLQLVILLLVGVSISAALIFRALSENINLFFTPTQIVAGEAPVDREIRAGGLVVPGSVKRDAESLHVEFVVTDTAAQTPIVYEGILPDLFREGQGIIAVGTLDDNGIVQARQVLAKHDENYMPPEVQSAIEAAGHPGDATSNY
jgi:cytochrome c-type biogenesis protein CcmE